MASGKTDEAKGRIKEAAGVERLEEEEKDT